jgi:two-component system chemotaxis response regulator CheY
MILGANAQICRLLSAVLAFAHFDVVEANSDHDLPSTSATGRPPDAVIIDDGLARFSGEAVLRRLRSDPRFAGLPMLVLTPLADPQIEARLRQSGASLVISKPFSSRRLLEALSALIAGPDG